MHTPSGRTHARAGWGELGRSQQQVVWLITAELTEAHQAITTISHLTSLCLSLPCCSFFIPSYVIHSFPHFFPFLDGFKHLRLYLFLLASLFIFSFFCPEGHGPFIMAAVAHCCFMMWKRCLKHTLLIDILHCWREHSFHAWSVYLRHKVTWENMGR